MTARTLSTDSRRPADDLERGAPPPYEPLEEEQIEEGEEVEETNEEDEEDQGQEEIVEQRSQGRTRPSTLVNAFPWFLFASGVCCMIYGVNGVGVTLSSSTERTLARLLGLLLVYFILGMLFWLAWALCRLPGLDFLEPFWVFFTMYYPFITAFMVVYMPVGNYAAFGRTGIISVLLFLTLTGMALSLLMCMLVDLIQRLKKEHQSRRFGK